MALNTIFTIINNHTSLAKNGGNIAFDRAFLLLSYPEELFSGTRVERSVGDLSLLGQVFCALYRRDHPFHSQESSQIGSVGWNDDQSEEPPHTSNNTARQRPEREREWGRET